MKRFLGSIFCICLVFSPFALAEAASPSLTAGTSQTQNFDPFTKFGKWVKKLFRRDPKAIACFTANVTRLTLDQSEITSGGVKEIKVSTEAYDRDGDTLLYFYKISGGEIIGSGPRVIWNLSGAAPGSYTITAAVDDGCGLCGLTVTKTVRVVE